MNVIIKPILGEFLPIHAPCWRNSNSNGMTPMDNLELILNERLRQARLSFNLALAMTAATTVMGLVGIGLLYAKQIQAGAVTTTSGVALSVCCFKLAKDANDRLDKISTEFDETEGE
jgi:hypothetical protein